MDKTWVDCLNNLVFYTGIGAGVGTAAGVLFFSRRIPVILYFAGIGSGYSYFACENNMKKLYEKLK